MDAAYIFRTTQTIPGIFDTLFGGLFVVKGVPLAGQLAVLTGLPIAIFLLMRSHRRKSPGRDEANSRAGKALSFDSASSRAAEAIGILVFTLLTAFCLQPWDEVFINLRHAQNLAEVGKFSFNAAPLSEGTVDFLPYFTIGILHRIGLPLIELAFAMSWLGALAALFALRRLFVAWGLERWCSVLMVVLCTYATLIFNASNGFANSVFAAVILWSIADLFFGGNRTRGWCALALLPLVRLEGAWFSLLLAAAWYREFRPRWRRMAPLALALLLPTLALSYYRWRTFGDWVPVPIRYKAGLGNFFLTVVGIRNAVADLIASGAAVALFVLAMGGLAGAPVQRRRTGTVLAALALGCAPYYSGGGDWFPSYWGRYLLAFTLFAVAVGASRLLQTSPADRRSLGGATGLVFVLHLCWPISSYYKLGEMFFAHRRTMARIHEPTIARGHYRVQHLSSLGYHLRRTTDDGDVIASSEIATIMFFAHRPVLDLLGVTNAEVAGAPLREFPSLLRKFPERSELPYLIFKRLQPALLARHRPPILYTFDFMMRDLIEGLPHDEITDADLFRGLHRWQRKLGGLVDELYGGIGNLLALGYRPVIVSYGNDFVSLYFVSAEARERHLAALRAAGLLGGWVQRGRR